MEMTPKGIGMDLIIRDKFMCEYEYPRAGDQNMPGFPGKRGPLDRLNYFDIAVIDSDI